MKEKKCEAWESYPRPLGSEGGLRKLKKRDVRRENRTQRPPRQIQGEKL